MRTRLLSFDELNSHSNGWFFYPLRPIISVNGSIIYGKQRNQLSIFTLNRFTRANFQHSGIFFNFELLEKLFFFNNFSCDFFILFYFVKARGPGDCCRTHLRVKTALIYTRKIMYNIIPNCKISNEHSKKIDYSFIRCLIYLLTISSMYE